MTPPELEAIARIIEPFAWGRYEGLADQEPRDPILISSSLEKAKSILALLPAPRAGEDVVERFKQAMLEAWHKQEPHSLIGDSVFLAGWEACEKAALASASLLRQPEVAGWQLVPKEPTEEMYEAARHALKQYIYSLTDEERKALYSKKQKIYKVTEKTKHRVRYQAMLSAAPSQQSEGRLGDWRVEELAQEVCRICEPDRHQDSAVRQIKVESAIATWLKRYVTPSPNPDARNRALEEALGELKQANDDLDIFGAPRVRGGLPLSVPGRIVALAHDNNREVDLLRDAALDEAAAHLRDMGYWTQGAAVLALKSAEGETK